jgi:hypothetical protein
MTRQTSDAGMHAQLVSDGPMSSMQWARCQIWCSLRFHLPERELQRWAKKHERRLETQPSSPGSELASVQDENEHRIGNASLFQVYESLVATTLAHQDIR